VRWTGEVKADHSQTYTFSSLSNNGVRLWVGGMQVVNNWSNPTLTENSGTITLQAGQWYPLTLEYNEGTGTAQIALSYASASIPKQIIPSDHLRLDTTPPTVTQIAPAAGASAVPASANVEAIFSEPMNAASITAATFTLQKQGAAGNVPDLVSYAAGATKATLNPSADLEAGASYTATVNGRRRRSQGRGRQPARRGQGVVVHCRSCRSARASRATISTTRT
jgi:hypothetical protein